MGGVTSLRALVMSVLRHPRNRAGSTYLPSILTERWTPGVPWGIPDRPTTWPRTTRDPTGTSSEDKYETEILSPGVGSMVTVRMPATEPAKVTLPDAGALTAVPTGVA